MDIPIEVIIAFAVLFGDRIYEKWKTMRRGDPLTFLEMHHLLDNRKDIDSKELKSQLFEIANKILVNQLSSEDRIIRKIKKIIKDDEE